MTIHTCVPCNYSSEQKSHYDRHLITKTHRDVLATINKNNRNTYPCMSCGKSYFSQSAQRRHIKNRHMDDKSLDAENKDNIIEECKQIINAKDNIIKAYKKAVKK